jgi:hypothetical protein
VILAVNSLAAPLVLLFAAAVLGITWVAAVLAALVFCLRDRDAGGPEATVSRVRERGR